MIEFADKNRKKGAQTFNSAKIIVIVGFVVDVGDKKIYVKVFKPTNPQQIVMRFKTKIIITLTK